MRASWEKTDLGNGAAVCTAQASMWGTTQSVSYVVYPTTMFSTRVAVCDTPAKTSMIAKDKKHCLLSMAVILFPEIRLHLLWWIRW